MMRRVVVLSALVVASLLALAIVTVVAQTIVMVFAVETVGLIVSLSIKAKQIVHQEDMWKSSHILLKKQLTNEKIHNFYCH